MDYLMLMEHVWDKPHFAVLPVPQGIRRFSEKYISGTRLLVKRRDSGSEKRWSYTIVASVYIGYAGIDDVYAVILTIYDNESADLYQKIEQKLLDMTSTLREKGWKLFRDKYTRRY